MLAASDAPRELRFACTSCGACCNRSPEVQLSEAAALADVFVFRLMFRLYELPRAWSGQQATPTGPGSAEEFYEAKRLLAAFAARKYPAKARPGGKIVETTRYVTISALTLNSDAGPCAALGNGRCTIYERRPLACRTVPFHYSRPEAAAEKDLKAFVETEGYGCDTGPGAPVVVAAGRIVDPEARRARADALARAGQDRRWEEAILRRLKTGAADHGLPSLREIEANAAFGATTISMRVAWQIAAEAGLLGDAECRRIVAAQTALIERTLAAPGCAPDERRTLAEMRAEYLALLEDDGYHWA
jgi:Fe-S-cluster containining protein